MITPSRIARFLGLVGLAAFLGLAARTSTATQAFDGDETPPPPPPPTIGGASLINEPRPVLVSRVDAFPFAQDDSEPAALTPPVAPDEIIPPHEPAVDPLGDLDPIPAPPATVSKPKDKPEAKDTKGKPAKDAAPEIVPAPLAPADSLDNAPPIAPDLTGDDFPAITPTPEPLSVDPAKAPQVPVDDPIPAPAPVERPKAWKPQRDDSPRPVPAPAPAGDIVVQIDEAPVITSNDPDAQARSFVERNQREAEARLKALQGEAEELRGRLAKIEAAIQQWQSLADAMRKAQGAAVKTEAPQPKPEAPADAETQPKATTSLEPLPAAPRQAVLVSEPQSARAQDVPAPALR